MRVRDDRMSSDNNAVYCSEVLERPLYSVLSLIKWECF